MREKKFDVIVTMFSTIEHKTLQEAIEDEDVLVRGGILIPVRGVYIRDYIGIKDKNGVEIYDKDKVKWFGEIMFIEWDDKQVGWGMVTPSRLGHMRFDAGTAEQVEVVGNEFEA